MRKRNKVISAVVVSAAAIELALGGLTMAHVGSVDQANANTGDPLVYVCPDTQGHTSVCTNNQEFEVFDKNGAPIISVGETGGLGTFGDNQSVYAPSSVFTPAMITSYTTPAIYDQTFGIPNTCVAPERWDSPQGTWTCSAGKWVKRVSY
jgi:hypothetical protein